MKLICSLAGGGSKYFGSSSGVVGRNVGLDPSAR
eukprot:SAG22_NODE_23719_length_136_cov_40.891892_1_plen_33_part_10